MLVPADQACRNSSGSRGGGIDNEFQESVKNSTIANNQALGAFGEGGGLFVDNTDTLNLVILDGNTSSWAGGGIYNFASTVNMTNVTMRGNQATGNTTNGVTRKGIGGAIYNEFAVSALRLWWQQEGSLRYPGATRLLVTTVKDATVVPDEAVQHGAEGLYAYAVSADRKAELRKLHAHTFTRA